MGKNSNRKLVKKDDEVVAAQDQAPKTSGNPKGTRGAKAGLTAAQVTEVAKAVHTLYAMRLRPLLTSLSLDQQRTLSAQLRVWEQLDPEERKAWREAVRKGLAR